MAEGIEAHLVSAARSNVSISDAAERVIIARISVTCDEVGLQSAGYAVSKATT